MKFTNTMKKCSEEMQILLTGCSRRSQKFSPHRRPTSRGHGTAKI